MLLKRSPTVLFFLPAALLLALIVSACSPAASVQSVATTLGSSALLIGDTTQADATVTATGGASQDVTWSSTNTAVATVDSTGLVTAVSTGTTDITATSTADTTKSGSATLSVATPLASRSVLYYNDAVEGSDTVGAALDAAVIADGLDLTVADDADFVSLLDESPDLVVYNRQGDEGLEAGHETALINWIAGGGYLAFTTWDTDGAASVAMAAAMQATFDGTENYADMTIIQPELASGLSATIVQLINTDWGTYNVGLETLPGGTVLATYEEVDSAAIVGGNEGRTMMLGFLSDTVPEDDGEQLYTNIFEELMRHRFHAGH